jgi:SAM-dependent methyltransferase
MRNIEQKRISDWKEVAHTDRGVGEYLRFLNLGREDLEDKKILDIGAGLGKFAEGAAKENISNKIYSLEPFLSIAKEEIISGTKEKTDYSAEALKAKEKMVAGIAEEMPFKENTFDLVLSLYAMPLYAISKMSVLNFFRNIIKITKNGGEIRLYPINRTRKGKALTDFWPSNQNGLDDFINTQINVLQKRKDLAVEIKYDENIERDGARSLVIIKKF